MTQYIPPSKEEQLIKDFLIWCGKEKGAVLVDITPNVTKMSSVTFINQMNAVEEYVASRFTTLEEGWAYV